MQTVGSSQVLRMLVRPFLTLFIVGGLVCWLLVLTAQPMGAHQTFSWADTAWLLGEQPDPSLGLGASQQTNTPGRMTVLVMGVDRRPWQDRDASTLTDTMMLLSLDTEARTASLLSIPRDLWLPMPLSSDRVMHDRMNSAYAYGEALGFPGGGPALAKATLEYNFGIRIHHYVMVDFETFERFIDAVGGVDINLAEPINDPTFPTPDLGVMLVRLPAGRQHLTGEQALWVARSRRQSSDFSRMARQQQLVMGVRDQVLRLEMLPRIPQLYLEYRDAVKTDLPLTDVVSLVRSAASIPADRIRTGTLDQEYVTRGTVNGDPFVLLPNRAKIATLIGELFGKPAQ